LIRQIGDKTLEVLKIICAIIISYILGSVLSGDIVAKLKKVNVRASGSGNIGATNVYRSMGALYGALVLIGDAVKGILAVLLGIFLGQAYGLDLGVVAGIFVIVGHNWSIFANFHGGKGIATSLGVVIALTPLTLFVLFPAWFGMWLVFRYVSLASIIAVIAYPVSVFWMYPGDLPKLIFAVVLALTAVYRHKENIGRIVRGEESKFSFKKRKDANEG
jgi:acyl phosphate:glycerol-3-phosphate acyltransferase